MTPLVVFDYLGIFGSTMCIFVKDIILIHPLAEKYLMVALLASQLRLVEVFSSMILELYIPTLFSCFIRAIELNLFL